MQITNHGLKMPISEEIYNVEPFNNNVSILEEHLSDTDIHVNAQKIAEIKGIEVQEVINITNRNASSLLGL